MTTKKELENQLKLLNKKIEKREKKESEIKTFAKMGACWGTVLGLPLLAKQLHK